MSNQQSVQEIRQRSLPSFTFLACDNVQAPSVAAGGVLTVGPHSQTHLITRSDQKHLPCFPKNQSMSLKMKRHHGTERQKLLPLNGLSDSNTRKTSNALNVSRFWRQPHKLQPCCTTAACTAHTHTSSVRSEKQNCVDRQCIHQDIAH